MTRLLSPGNLAEWKPHERKNPDSRRDFIGQLSPEAFNVPSSVTSTKSLNVNKSCPKMISLKNYRF